MTEDRLMELIVEAIYEVAKDQNITDVGVVSAETRLFGDMLDSMGLLFLITDLEEKLEDEFDKSVTLADERAMSQRTSPFRRVSTLHRYVARLLQEEEAS